MNYQNIEQDSEIFSLIQQEGIRQQDQITLIPSENYASPAVQAAVGSALSNKYSEGYAGKRYYEGNDVIDQVELLAIQRAKDLFGVPFANVQPYSGSPANSEIFFALAEPGSTVMGLRLASGGHLTHGAPLTFSSKYYNSVQFGLTQDARIDYNQMRELARQHKPKIIILGTTAYPFILDWKLAREIADEVGSFLVADISHIVGLVVTGDHPTPVPYAHVIMSTMHKSIRGPRGAIILVTDEGIKKDPDLFKKINSSVMPGMQGGPHNNTTAGIAVAFREAATPAFKEYSKQIVVNARVLADSLVSRGIQLTGGGTENHLMVMDFYESGEGKGTLVSRALNFAGIVTNRNTVPKDTSPFFPSGVRIGTPAVTTRGMKEKQMEQIAEWISRVVGEIKDYNLPATNRAAFLAEFEKTIIENPLIKKTSEEVKQLCKNFPVPGIE